MPHVDPWPINARLTVTSRMASRLPSLLPFHNTTKPEVHRSKDRVTGLFIECDSLPDMGLHITMTARVSSI